MGTEDGVRRKVIFARGLEGQSEAGEVDCLTPAPLPSLLHPTPLHHFSGIPGFHGLVQEPLILFNAFILPVMWLKVMGVFLLREQSEPWHGGGLHVMNLGKSEGSDSAAAGAGQNGKKYWRQIIENFECHIKESGSHSQRWVGEGWDERGKRDWGQDQMGGN